MAEKKKGFWSWLGLGKKEETKQAEPHAQAEEEKTEQLEQKAATLKESVEQLAEQAEEKLEQFEDAVEDKFEQAEAFFEQKTEKLEDFVETKVEEVKAFLQEAASKVEQAFEEEKEASVSIIDTAKQEAEQHAVQPVEAVPEATEPEALVAEEPKSNAPETAVESSDSAPQQAVESAENFTDTQTAAAAVDHHAQIATRIEQVLDAELSDAVPTKSDAEEEFEELEELVELEGEKAESDADEYQEKPSRGGFFSRLLKGLVKTKQSIGSGFRHFFRGKKIDDDLFEALEEQLLVADLGMPTTTKIIQRLTQHATKQQLQDAEQLYQQLKLELAEVLKPVDQPLVLTEKKPYVILMVGVNGVGKTTTIGKLARKFQDEGKSVMLAAGDTFRAAAVEQLQVWGERNHIPVVAQATGADSASVIFDAMQSAASKGVDVLIADTAGRLQNKNNLMDELKKIVRVMKKHDETAPHEIMLTLDAGTGQNAISQAKLFNEAVGLTGITLTKLDGTAKGGVIFAIADQFNLPIRFIGVGEKIEDLRPFNAEEFIDALFEHEE